MLHLDGRCGDGEAEVFVGHGQVCHGDGFVLDLTGRYCFVLVEVKRARDHSFRGLVGLVAAWRSRVGVLAGVVGVGLTLELAGSVPARSAGSSSSASASASAARREPLSLLGSDGCRHR